jgi:hypothetical protein
MRPDTITLAIYEQFTPQEKTEIADQMAKAIADLETVKEEKKVSDAAFGERMKRHIAQINEFAKRYNKGGESAQIGCDIKYDDPEPGKKSYYRMDKGELVETHDMSWEEKQETIQFPLAKTEGDDGAATPPNGEEVTRLCPFPKCILFADHDGDHEFAKQDPTPDEIDQALGSLDIRITEVPPDEPPDLEAAGD